MDPVSDLPLLPALSTASVPATVADNHDAPAPAHNHPPYAEMITAAIAALEEGNGSSKNAIAKYLETHYTDLPSTHAELLTHHLKQLKIEGQVLMVKHSYKLLRSAPAPVNGDVNHVSASPKRRPGRPPKIKPDSVQVAAAVPVFEPPININDLPVNGPDAAGPTVRGRGRPPKQVGLKRGPGRPPKSGGVGRPKVAAAPVVQGRPRGRPRKPTSVNQGLDPATVAVPAADRPVPGKRRGRPPRAAAQIPSVEPRVEPVSGKRRGRPPRSGAEAKRPRKLSGKALGRPKKNTSAAAVNRSPDSQLLVAYLDLKAKLENLQTRISETANFIKPSLNSDDAINALQQLELIAMNVTTPAFAHQQQQPQPPLEQ